MTYQDGGVHVPFLQIIEDCLGVGIESGGPALAGAVARAVDGDRVQLGGQSRHDRLPVGGGAWLAVEED